MCTRKQRAQASIDRRCGLAVELLVDDRFCEAPNTFGALLSRMRKGPTASINCANFGSAPRRWSTATAGSNPNSPSPSKNPRGTFARGAFDGEQAEFRNDATVGGESAELTAGSEHAMTRHDDRKRIVPERLPDGAR